MGVVSRHREPSRRSRREANGVPRNEVTRELGLAYGCLLMAVSRVGAATGCDNVNALLPTPYCLLPKR